MSISNDPTVAQFKSRIGDLNQQIEKINGEMSVYEKKVQGQPAAQEIQDLKETPPVAYWGDQRMNPLFLKVAEYFGIDQREYPRAESKLTSILEWASETSKSKNIGDILKEIAKTSKHLQSAGYGEKPYAILYRYIKLDQQGRDLKKQMEAYKK